MANIGREMQFKMNSRIFEDLNGNVWIVTRTGSHLAVKGHRNSRESLCEVARSCAKRLGVTHTKSGVLIEYINEHRRIWNTIWEKGRKT